MNRPVITPEMRLWSNAYVSACAAVATARGQHFNREAVEASIRDALTRPWDWRRDVDDSGFERAEDVPLPRAEAEAMADRVEDRETRWRAGA